MKQDPSSQVYFFPSAKCWKEFSLLLMCLKNWKWKTASNCKLARFTEWNATIGANTMDTIERRGCEVNFLANNSSILMKMFSLESCNGFVNSKHFNLHCLLKENNSFKSGSDEFELKGSLPISISYFFHESC